MSRTRCSEVIMRLESKVVAYRKLDMLYNAHEEKDLRAPLGNRFERLKGKLRGKCSIRVNDRYRLVFRWDSGNATEVAIADYH